MKKTLSVFLAVILFCTSFSVLCFAKNKCGCSNTPVVMVSGFGATTLVKTNEDGSEKIVFPFNKDDIKAAIKYGVGTFNPDTPRLFLGEIAAKIVDPLRMNPDGTSYYDIRPIYSAAEDTSLAAFKANDALQYIPYTGSVFLDMECIAEKTGDDHVFNFLYDWRLSSDEVADSLYSYIKDVLELTGHDKVSIYSLSQGSICVAQYLYKYANKKLVDNVIFNNPIMDGTDFVSDVFLGAQSEYNFNFNVILTLVANIAETETDYGKFAKFIPKGANFIAQFGAQNYILPVVKDSPAYIEMITDGKFEEICKAYDFSDELLEKVNKVRNGYMADIKGTLKKAEKYGATVSIVSCSGINLVSGTNVSSDSIVNMSTSCGAYCSEKPFSEKYVQKKNIGKNCISPDRKTDLSAGYLPERTWIINELYHGQVEMAECSLELLKKLLLTHELKDAWSSYEFPQFMQSDDPLNDFHLKFLNTNCLYGVKGESGSLVLKNISEENSMYIEKIEIDGKELTDTFKMPFAVKPGECVEIKVDTEKERTGNVKITYYEKNGAGNLKTKNFSYTVTENYDGVVSDGEKIENEVEFTFFNRVKSGVSHFINGIVAKIKHLIFK